MENDIKERIDAYPLTHVDCIEKAICCMLNEYNEQMSTVYLLYNEWFGCFEKIDAVKTEIEVQEFLCNNGILPIKFNTMEVLGQPVSKAVEKLLKNGATCLVPADLNELFYSKYYHNSHWPHLFFVRKSNEQESLLYIFDSCQKNENEQKFSPFVMEYDKLDRIYQLFCETFPENMMYKESNVIYYFYPSNDSDSNFDYVHVSRQLLKDLPKTYNGTIELELVNALLNNSDSQVDKKDEISEFLTNKKILFNRIIKSKEVFYSEIIKNIFSEEHQAEILNSLDELVNKWNTFFRLMVASVLRKKTDSVITKLEKVIAEEKDFIVSLNDSLISFEKMATDSISNNVLMVHNEKPGEVRQDGNHVHIETSKNHNAWIVDEAIEVVCHKFANDQQLDDRLEIKVTMSGAYTTNNFNAGLFIKTHDERFFTWGIYNQECLRLSEIGVKVDKEDYLLNNLNNMVLVAEASGCDLLLKSTVLSGETLCTKLKGILSSIKEIGIVLKTWENTEKEMVVADFEVVK